MLVSKTRNHNKPLGQKVKSRKNEATKVTDNQDGWATVAGIAVPPDSDNRIFHKPLGLKPILLNGATFPEQKVAVVEPPAPTATFTPEPAPIEIMPEAKAEPRAMKTIDLEWFGSTLTIQCLNAVYQAADPKRGNKAWILLELTTNKQTKKPIWLPPAAIIEDGKIQIPELYCSIDEVRYKCQILNIEVFDLVNEKYVLMLSVID